jgi:hypothetical protein
MYRAERVATQRRSETQVRLRDALVIGILQCVALIPGVSRSGATISGGLFVGLNRAAATRLSFFLSIPALVAAGGYEAATSASDVASGVGWLATGVATVVSFGVAYASIAWLRRFVSGHPITSSSATAWFSRECSSSPCQPVPSPRCDGAPTGVTSVGAQYSWSGYFHASLTAPGSPARSNDAS